MKYENGDLIKKALNGEFEVIVHGCNCFNTMGAGIAKQIKYNFPEAYQVDSITKKGDKEKLGKCSFVQINRKNIYLTIVNAYTQYRYGREKVSTYYSAIRKCMKWIKENFHDKKIGMPLIGAGLGGGDWKIISRIINQELEGEDVTIVKYRKD